MKTETKEIYKCEYCNKLYQIKNYCLKHENICHKNPDNNRPCFSCHHLSKKTETLYYDTYNGEQKRIVELLYCDKIKSFLYPPKVEIKGNQYETDTIENNPMPKQCDIFDSEGNIDLFDNWIFSD